MATRPSKTLPKLCEAIRRLRPSSTDREAIAALVGNTTCKTLAEVAEHFGLAESTLKTGWRPTGMPGRAGAYRLAEILLWRIDHDAMIGGYADDSPDADVNAAEQFIEAIETLEANLSKKFDELRSHVCSEVEGAVAEAFERAAKRANERNHQQDQHRYGY